MKKSNVQQFFYLFLFTFHFILNNTPTLLIKIPTRSRPEKFFSALDLFYKKLSGKIPYHFLITCDIDDASMNNASVIEQLKKYQNLTVSFNDNHTKIEAYNRDLEKYNFDILLAASDDMAPVVDGYDEIIVNTMLKHFPDLDGVLNFNDGYTNNQHCNIMPIIGKKFFSRFGYLYCPVYKSLCCDNELMLVSRILNREAIFKDVIISHNHPANTNEQLDELYKKNEKIGKSIDYTLFAKRRAHLFDLPQSWLNEVTPKLWSILICTMEERTESFNHLYNKLMSQIRIAGLENKIEILYFRDKRGEHTIGFKRNELLKKSQGKYVNFLDDDDDVHKNYIKMIYEKLLKNPDCVSLVGILKIKNKNRRFIHSIRYKKYFIKNKIYYRPPNHLNTMKRHIAIQNLFPEINFEEDTRWAMMIANKNLLHREEIIKTPYYFYYYNPNKENYK